MYPYWIPEDHAPPERSARQIALRSRRSAREAELLRYAQPARAAKMKPEPAAPATRTAPLGRFSLLFGRARG